MNEENKDVFQNSKGMELGTVEGGNFTNVVISGYQTGMRIQNVKNSTFSSVTIISLEALQEIENTKKELTKIKIDEQKHLDILLKLEEIKSSTSRDGAINSYMKLMSSLSDHVTVLSPLLPSLCLLAGSLSS